MTTAMEDPSSAVHLWRSTPWAWMKPDDAESTAIRMVLHDVEGPATAALSEGSSDLFPVVVDGPETTLPDVDDIARHTLANLDARPMRLDIDGTHEGIINLDLRAAGHVAVGRLHIACKGQAVVHLHVSGDAGWCGLHLTGQVANGSTLSVAVTDELHLESRVVRCDDWRVGRDATFETGTLSVGGFRRKSDLRHHLDATGGNVRIGLGVHGQGSRHDDHHVEIHHHAGHTNSSLVANVACGGRSRSVGTGRLVIDAGADGTDAGQVFRNLLLSQGARADAIPELEVLADDVSAAHGAASASIDDDQLHYLMSRGLDHGEASDMIVEGFLADAFRPLSAADARRALRDRLTVHLDCARIT